MYQSYFKRDLEKRARKDRKMYACLGIAVTVGLVLSIFTLMKSINGSEPPSGVDCNQTLATALQNFCHSNAEERLANVTNNKFGITTAINLHCCVSEAWKKCTDKALSKSGCGRDDKPKMLPKKVCLGSCDSEEETRKMLSNLEDLMASYIGKSGPTVRVEIQRKPKKWNGFNWNDEIVTDDDTSEATDDSDEGDIDQLFANMTSIDNSEEDTSSMALTSMTSMTSLTPTIASTLSTSEKVTTSNDTTPTNWLVLNTTTAVSRVSTIDEIGILVEEEEGNVQEDDTIANETAMDTSDFIEGTRKMRAMVDNNSAYLIEVNLFLAFVNIFGYTLFILFE